MNYKNINDYEVLYMIGESDELSYSIMYDKYHPLISNLANKYYNNYKGCGLDYDDLYQEGMVALNNAIREFNDNNNCLFYTYSLVCIKREMERLIKKSMRLKHMVLNNCISMDKSIGESDLFIEDIIEDPKKNNSDNLLEIKLSKKILDLKYNLSDRQAMVYELKLNNFTNKEISLLLDINYKAVDNSLRLIKSKLKQYVIDIKDYMI